MTTFTLKRGDVGAIITDTLTTGTTATPVNLTGATVKFLMRNGDTLVSQTATVVSPTDGTVSYTTVAADLATVGWYNQEWEVTFSGGAKRTFPSSGYNRLLVLNDLNPAA